MADSCGRVSRSWSTDLSSELLEEILSHLDNELDILRCWNVCVSWRLAATRVYQNNHVNRIPLLLTFNREDGSGDGILRNILCGDSETVHLPNPQDWRVFNSTNGWLLIIGRFLPYRIVLYNPISRNEVLLPLVGEFPEILLSFNNQFKISRCIASTANPLDQDCAVLILYACNLGKKLAFCRPGDQVWKSLHDLDQLLDVSFVDIMIYKGQLYATDIKGRIYGLFLGSCPKIIFLMEPPFQEIQRNRSLVESFSGDFLMIVRKWDWVEENDEEYEKEGTSIFFEVYKIDLNRRKWKKIETLGDEVLFLGPNSRTSVSVSELVSSISENSGLVLSRGNRIFFVYTADEVSPDDSDGFKYASMYDFRTSCIKRLYASEFWTSQFHWIVPDLS